MGQNKIKTAVVSILALSLAFGAGVTFSDKIQSKLSVNATALDEKQQSRYKEILNKLSEIDKVIDKYYMDDASIDPEMMREGVYKGYVYGLEEPYTTYYTAEEYKQLIAQSEGVYSGIGVTVTQDMQTGQLVIVEITKGGPSENIGLMAGDVISKVDGESVEGQSMNEVVAKIQGEEGTEVIVTVFRPSTETWIEKTIVRQTLDDVTVTYELLQDDIGYIRLSGFEQVTVKQFKEAVDTLLSQGMKGLVVDVRGNPGGNMDSVCPILDAILPEGLLVYTEDKNGHREEEYANNEEILDLPMAVLTNGGSASASEIFAAALQDYEWAEIVGTQTYGKGIVQYIIPFADGSAIKLTSAKYFTPNGQCIHGIGVTPDIKVENDDDASEDEQLLAAVEAVKKQLFEASESE